MNKYMYMNCLTHSVSQYKLYIVRLDCMMRSDEDFLADYISGTLYGYLWVCIFKFESKISNNSILYLETILLTDQRYVHNHQTSINQTPQRTIYLHNDHLHLSTCSDFYYHDLVWQQGTKCANPLPTKTTPAQIPDPYKHSENPDGLCVRISYNMTYNCSGFTEIEIHSLTNKWW